MKEEEEEKKSKTERPLTCSSPMRHCNRSLSSGPCRPPLLELIKTISGPSGGVEASAPAACAASKRTLAAGAFTSLAKMDSFMAIRRYSGIVIFFRSSSFGIRIPARVHPFKDSMTDDLPDDVAAPARGCRDVADDELVVSRAEDAAAFVLGESI